MGYTKVKDGKRPCIECGKIKPLDQFYRYPYKTKQGKASFRYEPRCAECARLRRRLSYAINGEKDNANSKAWRVRNADHRKQYLAKRQQDPAVRAMKAAHQRARKARIRSRTEGTEKPEILALYKEARELQDAIGVPMHVDHIQPLKLGGKHTMNNLQILTATENLRKGARPARPAVARGAADA